MNSPLNPFALLLIGPPKSGKSNVAFAFPDPVVLDCDMNLESAIRRQPGKKFIREFIDFEAAPDGKVREVPLDLRWPRLLNLTAKYADDPSCSTLIIDSLQKVRPYLCDWLLSQNSAVKDLIIGGQKMMTQSHWGPYATLLGRFIAGLRRIKKYVIVTAHIHADKDETTGRWFYKPSVGGQSEDTLAGLFTDVWLCEPQISGSGVKYVVRVQPTPQMVLGNTLNLPDPYEFNWKDFEGRLKAANV